MDNISHYLTFDLPVPYKDLMLYPVTLKDYTKFYYFAQCFTLDKNSIPDARIISMKELEYIYFSTQENPEINPYLIWFDRVLALSLKEEKSFESLEKSITEKYRYYENNQHNPYFIINDKNYFEEDYQNIKKIICRQNLVDLPDERFTKEVRDSLEEAKKYKNKDDSPATLEDYIISLSVETGWKLDYIYNMTIRKFLNSLKRLDHILHYKIFLTASLSGFVEFKDKSFIKHWLANLEEGDRYKDISLDLEEVRGKISLDTAKKNIKKRIK